MRLRSFTAADMPTAINMVRAALGEGAIILSSETLADKSISVTAAIEEEDEDLIDAPISKAQRSEATDALRHIILGILRFHNLPELFIAKMMQKANDGELQAVSNLYSLSKGRDERQLHRLILEKLLASFFTFSPLTLDGMGARLMLVGAPGIGKTLTVAKIAARLAMENPSAKKEMTVITTDNKRAGGIEQLRAFTDILGIKLRIAANAAELRDAIKQAAPLAPLLIDTAGCNPYDAEEMAQLKSYAELAVEPVLAMQAGGDSLEAIDMVEVFAELPIRRLLITRADTARRFGGVLASAAAHRLALCNASSSSSIIDAPDPMDGALLAQFLLRYQLNQ